MRSLQIRGLFSIGSKFDFIPRFEISPDLKAYVPVFQLTMAPLLRMAPLLFPNLEKGGPFLISRNPKISRKLGNLDILNQEMDRKHIFWTFGAPQAPKIFACGAKMNQFWSILRFENRIIKNGPPFIPKSVKGGAIVNWNTPDRRIVTAHAFFS